MPPNVFQMSPEELEQFTTTPPESAWTRIPATGGRPAQVRQPKIDDATERARFRALQAIQQEDANAQRALADEYAQTPTGLDLSPLAALTDAWSGSSKGKGKSNFAGTYKAPLQQQDKTAMLMKLRALASDEQQKVTDEQLKMLNAAAKDETSMTRALMGGFGRVMSEGAQKNLDWNQQKEITNDVQKIQNPLSDSIQQLGQIESNLALNDYQGLMSTLSLFSRRISGEKGVLTEQDIGRALPKSLGTDMAKIVAYFSDGKAPITPEIAEGMRKLVDIAKEKTYDRYNNQIGSQLKTYKNTPALKALAQAGDLDRMYGSAYEMLNQIKPPPKDKKAAAAGAGKVYTKADLEAAAVAAKVPVATIKQQLKAKNVKFEE